MGIGNPAREDDGLGPAAAELIGNAGIPETAVDANYQLTVEDAATVAAYPAVVFIDASVDGPEPFSFARVKPEREESFSTHSVQPSGVVALAQDLFGAHGNVYILGIRGYSFNMFVEQLTPKASENLARAVEFLIPLLRNRSFEEALARFVSEKKEHYNF